MTEWKTYRFGDIVQFNPTERISKGSLAKKVSMDKLTPYCREVSGYEVETFTGGMKFRNGDTIMARITPCLENGKTSLVSFLDDNEVGFGSTEYIVFRAIEEVTDSKFVYYFVTSPAFRNVAIKSMVGSSGRQRVQQSVLEDLEVALPSLEEQRRIAGILGAIDDKIENNRRINTNLELQAQALYKQWFVDSSTVKLGDVVRTTSGGTPSRSHMEFYVGKYGWVKSKELNSSFITKTEETITDDAIAKSAAKLLPAKSILIAMYGATVGQYAILSQPMTCNQAVCALLPNENYPYTYLFMVAKNIKEELVNKAIGSAQQNISQVIIKDIDISSDIEKIKQFHKIVCPHFDVMEKNQKENETLTTLRDTLLPKLMNGEIKVTE